MTREEKKDKVIEYCSSRTACSQSKADYDICPLLGKCRSSLNFDFDAQYAILVKAGCIKDDEVETTDDKVKKVWDRREPMERAYGELEEAKQRFMNIGEKEICYPQVAHIPGNTASEFEAIHNAVNHPNHYTKGGIECISAIKASMTSDGFCDYCKGNIIKYIWRWRDKGGVQDLEKAKVYLDWLIEEAKNDRP